MLNKPCFTTVLVTCLLLAGLGCSGPGEHKNPKISPKKIAAPATQGEKREPPVKTEAKTTPSETVEKSTVKTNVVKEVGTVKKPQPPSPHPALLDPSLANETAPARFEAVFETTQGKFIIEVTRDWAPNGADRFYNLVRAGYFTDAAFFRNIDGFMVQFGIHGDPAISTRWQEANIKDDPVTQSNLPGFISFATRGPNTRTTQLFINFSNNSRLDNVGFSPFGKVIEGMDVVKSLYNGYGEGFPRGKGPAQGQIQSQGNTYLKEKFPKLDYVKSASIVTE